MAIAHNHHYLPQCYLRGFARSTSKKAQLHVYDVRDRRWFPTTARNVGSSRDFNRVDTEGFDPTALERKLAVDFEGLLAGVLQRMRETREIPRGDDLHLLMNLIAAVAIRNPSMRKQLHHWQARTAKLIGDIVVASKERWETTLQQMHRAGQGSHHDVTYEQAKDFHERGEYTIEVAQSRYFRLETARMDAILPTLARRKWTLFVTDGAKDSHFVTCDRPAMLVWADGAQRGPIGHALNGTALLVPVSKELALLGQFDVEARVVVCDDERVAKFNAVAVAFADRQVYSPRPTALHRE